MIGIALLASRAEAVDFESLVSPGPLVAAHAREVKECGDCHEAFDRGSQRRLCLRCHEPVARDIEAAEGFHGRLDGDRECRVCHTEHEGADAEIVGLVAESFDHDRTDFSLEGAHASLACTGCHEAGRPHREARHACMDCHGDSDPHAGRLGERCESCHVASSWREVGFDHATTRFPLEGLHADAECMACHPGQRFGETATACIACHGVDDVHRGQLGSACGECHSARGWKADGFDHGKQTRFALAGRHATLACGGCHASDPKQVKLASDCASCHRNDDDHQGLRGPLCDSCHDAKAWKPSLFDHARDAKSRLQGAHAELACELCHVREMGATKTPTACVDCHAAVDVHQGSLGRDCGACHGEESFRGRVRFDHDRSAFPLLALHQLASCEDCHVTHVYGRTESSCQSCHGSADAHEGRLGPDCARCHNPNGWERWLFDHGRETRFALQGAHTNLQCVACHHAVPARSGEGALALPTSCRGCHLGDSPHDDAYGRDCERCHVDTSWKQIEERLR